MALSFAPVVTAGIAKQIATNIREAIFSGQLRVDQRLPTEEDLATQFGVSRPTIREALKRLAAQNLIRSQRGPAGGTFVTRPSQRELEETLANATTLLAGIEALDFNDLLDVRQALETVCARLAAERRNQDDLTAIAAEIALEAKNDISDEEFCASDVRLHGAVVTSTKSPVIQLIMTGIVHALQPVGNMIVYRLRERQLIRRQHEELYQSILRQDPDGAAAAIVEQMEHMRSIYARLKPKTGVA